MTLDGWEKIRAKTAKLRAQREREKHERKKAKQRAVAQKQERKDTRHLLDAMRYRCDTCGAVKPYRFTLHGTCVVCRAGHYVDVTRGYDRFKLRAP